MSHTPLQPIQELLPELGLTLDEHKDTEHIQLTYSSTALGFKAAPHEGLIYTGDLASFELCKLFDGEWLVMSSKLSPEHPHPRLLVSADQRDDHTLCALPLGLEGRFPPTEMKRDLNSVATLLADQQGLMVFEGRGRGLIIWRQGEALACYPLAPFQKSDLSAVHELTRERVPAWLHDQLQEVTGPLQEVEVLGALARYLTPLIDPTREPHARHGEPLDDALDAPLDEPLDDPLDDPALKALKSSLEGLEGWSLPAERVGLERVKALRLSLKALLQEPTQALLDEVIISRERLAQIDTAELLMEVSGPLGEALWAFDQEATAHLLNSEDARLLSLAKVSSPALSAAWDAHAMGWWLSFAQA